MSRNYMILKNRVIKAFLYTFLISALTWGVDVFGFRELSAQTWTTKILASQDSFVDLNNPTTNYDDQFLEITYSNFPDFVSTRFALLQFNLSGIVTVANGSRVLVELVENNLSVNATTHLTLYAIEDDIWIESSITYDTRPALNRLLQTISLTSNITGTVAFDNDAVGEYIEQERNTDEVVSFALRFDGGDGNLGFGGNILLEDREGSFTGLTEKKPTIDIRPISTVADLQIIKYDLEDPVIFGDTITYTLTVTNNGPDMAETVVLTDYLPTHVVFMSTLSSASCNEVAEVVACQLGDLASGIGSESIIVVNSIATGTIVNTATVSTITFDPNIDNNNTLEQTTVNKTETDVTQKTYLPIILKR